MSNISIVGDVSITQIPCPVNQRVVNWSYWLVYKGNVFGVIGLTGCVGKPGNWVLAKGSDIQHLTMAKDGTLYAYGKGLTYTLYKSSDSGRSWAAIGKVKDAIVDIAISPDNVVYYATLSAIYKSTDDSSKFIPLPSPGGAGSNGVEITSFDVTRLNNNTIVVGTRDTDNGEYGGVYILDETAPFTWTDTNVGSYDVYAVAFSPNFPGDRQLVAVVTNETDTLVTTKIDD